MLCTRSSLLGFCLPSGFSEEGQQGGFFFLLQAGSNFLAPLAQIGTDFRGQGYAFIGELQVVLAAVRLIRFPAQIS